MLQRGPFDIDAARRTMEVRGYPESRTEFAESQLQILEQILRTPDYRVPRTALTIGENALFDAKTRFKTGVIGRFAAIKVATRGTHASVTVKLRVDPNPAAGTTNQS